MQLSFLGGATTVSGSRYLFDTGDARVLIESRRPRTSEVTKIPTWRETVTVD